jgi:hypothetical protein
MAEPTSEPLTWLAIQAIAALFAPIARDDGWHTDLGSAAIHTDRSQRPAGDAPYVFVFAGEIPVNTASSGPRTVASDMDFTVEYMIPVAPGVSPELLAHRGRADIVRALIADPRDLPAGLRKIEITGTQIVSAVEPGSSLIVAQVTARAGLSESQFPAT